MTIDEIKNRRQVNDWLFEEDQGPKDCVLLAQRAAMRVAPLYFLQARPAKEDATASPLPVLRSLLVANASAFSTNREFPRAASAARAAATAAKPRRPRRLNRAVDAAANAARAGAFHTSSRPGAADAIAASAEAAGSWDAVHLDLSIAVETEVSTSPLWPTQNLMASSWENVVASWQSTKAHWNLQESSWRFWIDWYNAAFEGKQFDTTMLAEIAVQQDFFWRGTDDEVNERIARIRERHELLAEVHALKAERDAWRQAQAGRVQRSHNMPPELVDVPDEIAREIVVVWDALDDAERELEKPAPDTGRLAAIGRAILNACRAVLAYCGRLGDNVLSGATRAAGPPLGIWVVDHFILNGRLYDFAQRLLTFAGGG